MPPVADTEHPIVWLHHAGQNLGLVPSLGGSVAAWQIDADDDPIDLWRPWDGQKPDLYTLASFAMLPWSNRISHGGFTEGGQFHPMRPNRTGEPYPIHGDAWLQAWTLSRPAADTLVMSLVSQHFDGNPYAYRATQTFRLVDGGLDHRVEVEHLGDTPLPYGLGVHPWFPRTPRTRLHAPVKGVWLCGDDPLPTDHTHDFPTGWNLGDGMDANGSLIDNGFTGWDGTARITWPERELQLTLAMRDLTPNEEQFCLVYRPPVGPAFCFEPITQPIDAFHLPGRPGLRVLAKGERLALDMAWRFGAIKS
ncbi:MAG TPA: aldose 1-epimerase [Rhizobacter sp.]|nr:aldose 1-epimerase [Rhizobacter sp.]